MTTTTQLATLLALLLCLFFSVSQAQTNNIGCFIPGYCNNALIVDVNDAASPDDCLKFCKESPQCTHFTHFRDEAICFGFGNCPDVIVDQCPECVSGDVTCPYQDLRCSLPGRCDGVFVGIVPSINSAGECVGVCDSDPRCLWWSYNTADGICIKTSDCPTIGPCDTCLSGERGCIVGI